MTKGVVEVNGLWALEELLETVSMMSDEEIEETGLECARPFQGAKITRLEDAGYLTVDKGFEIKFQDGATVVITVQQR